MRSSILVVAKTAALRACLAHWLGNAGYSVELAESIEHARRVGSGKTFSLAIVVTDRSETPVLADELRLTTGRTLVIAPWAAGIDPAGTDALLAKVAAALRPEADPPPQPVLRFAGYTFDLDGYALTGPNGEPIVLTASEFALLRAFVRRPGRVLSREHLGHTLLGRGAEPYERGIDMLVARLRRKIEPDPKHPRIVVTVHGAGYKFAACPRPGGSVEVPAAAEPDSRPTAEAPDGRGPALDEEVRIGVEDWLIRNLGAACGIGGRREHIA